LNRSDHTVQQHDKKNNQRIEPLADEARYHRRRKQDNNHHILELSQQ